MLRLLFHVVDGSKARDPVLHFQNTPRDGQHLHHTAHVSETNLLARCEQLVPARQFHRVPRVWVDLVQRSRWDKAWQTRSHIALVAGELAEAAGGGLANGHPAASTADSHLREE